MEPVITGSLIAGGASLLSSLASSAFSQSEAEKARDWQEGMSNTAHQREVEDLRKAGLNPILSVKHGGASSPPGAQAQVPDFSQSVNSGLAAASAMGQMRVQAAQARDLNASALNKEIQGRVSARTEIEQIDSVRETLNKLRNDGDLSFAQRERVVREIRNLEQTLKILHLEESHSALDLTRARQESDFYSSFGGKVAPWLDHILGKLRIPSIPGRR